MKRGTVDVYRQPLGQYESRPEYFRYYSVDETKGYFPYDLVVKFIQAGQSKKENKGLSPDCRVLRIQMSQQGHIYHFSRINEEYLLWQIKTRAPAAIHIGLLMPIRLNPLQFNHFNTPEQDERALALRRRLNRIPEPSLQQKRYHNPSSTTVIHKLSEEDRRDASKNFVMPRKELIFDIDIPDYDRFCQCSGTKNLCNICWLHLEGSFFILNFILTQLYGYAQKNLLYVFSGGKGFHCFVNDSRAMALTVEQRLVMHRSIAVKNGRQAFKCGGNFGDVAYEGDRQLMQWMKLYEPERRAALLDDTLTHLFVELVLKSRNLLLNPAFREWVLAKARLHYPSCVERIRKEWQEALKDKEHCTSITLWQILYKFDAYGMLSVSKQPLVPFSEFVKYRLYYPQIDARPLVEMDHTIKLPFAIHPTTKNIALPFDQSFMMLPDKNGAVLSLDKLYQHDPNALPTQFIQGKHLLAEWNSHFKPLW